MDNNLASTLDNYGLKLQKRELQLHKKIKSITQIILVLLVFILFLALILLVIGLVSSGNLFPKMLLSIACLFLMYTMFSILSREIKYYKSLLQKIKDLESEITEI